MNQHCDMSGAPVLLLGGGGHARVVADAARQAGLVLAGYLDERAADGRGLEELGVPHRGSVLQVKAVLVTLGPDVKCHAAIGDAALRTAWLDACPPSTVTSIIHPSAVVSPQATLADGAFVGPGAIINSGATIGRAVIVNSGAIVEHDVQVGAFSHVAPGAVLAGGVVVGRRVLIGSNATVIPNLIVGDDAVAGAGAVVTHNIPAGQTVAGVPARPITAPVA